MKQIGSYLVDEIPIGSGGMGHVFRGVAPDGITKVAIKEILPNFVADIEYRSRIEREIEFLKMLNNDHVVHIFDHFEIGGNLYIVMEYIEGLNIEQYVEKNGAIGWQDALKYMVQLLLTMQDVHAHGIVHRDIKPSNIMIRPNGQICLLDFGVAKDVTNNSKGGGTVFGTIIGTDGYMSPEQAQGMSIDHRSDIYGLGCVLYFMLTGTHAFGNMGSELRMQIAITSRDFPRLSDKVGGLPQKLQKILDNAVNKNMMSRYQSCREFATDLSSMLPGGTQIDTLNRTASMSVSVGRENCDILVGSENMKVSRHHADISLKQFTGGEFYVYTDCSSNGTTIDGHFLHKGMSYNIPKGTSPIIFLANDPLCPLDMSEVALLLERKKKNAELNNSELPRKDIRKKSRSISESETFIGAVQTCFSKYADFSGRASRSEFWWFSLFNFLVGLVLSFTIGINIDFFFCALNLYQLGVLLPSLAVFVRRLHDTDRSWVNILWTLLPFIGGIVLLVYLVQKGNPGDNRFGPSVS